MSEDERAASTHAEPQRSVRLPAMRLVLYVRLVVALGAAAILWSVPALVHIPHPFVWLLLVALALLAGQFAMRIASVAATFSVTDTFFMASAIFFGPAPATITVALSTGLASYRRGHRGERLAFNTAALSLSMWIAARAFFLLAKVQPLAQAQTPIGQVMGPLVVLAATYFMLNSGLMAGAIGLESGQSPLVVWRKHFLWLSLSFFAAGSVAFCLILLIEQVSIAAAAMTIPLVIIFHLTLRASYGRLEDAQVHLASMDRLYLSTIETLAMAIDAKDDVTHSHVRRVQAYAVGLARALGITDELMIKAIKAAALLHDTGKLAVPEHILNKPGGLTPSEFDTMKLHVDVGADILSLVDFPFPVVPIVRCHHESWDGSGYPRGVSGENIPIGARILSVVDCYDALTSDRPYRRALSDEAALDILRARRGTMYDPTVVDTFIAVHLQIELGEPDRPEQRQVLKQIGQSRTRSAAGALHAAAPLGEAPPASDDVLAFVSLARLTSGEIALADVLALSSKLMRDIVSGVPGASAAWYLLEPGGTRLSVFEVSGQAAPILRGMSVGLGERLTGWVAANRQVIVNSDAGLDLGERAASVTPALESCMSVPLVSGDVLVGVLSLYAAGRSAFTDDQGRLVQMVTPHIAQALARAQKRPPADILPMNRELRLVARG